jgi:protein-S-isoprenylcysteine O-methyltransferase Ste14
MPVDMDVLITFILYFLIFAVIHSLLATDYIKNKAERLLKEKFRFYRLLYTIVSFPTFAPAFLVWLKYSTLTPLVYRIPDWLYPVFLLVRFLGIGLFVYAVFQTDILEFIGIKQTRKETESKLITGGAYGIVRHPMYIGGIAALFTKMEMSQLDLTAVLLVSIYLAIGAFIEEKRLISTFGDEYRRYRQQVSMFIPIKWIMRLKSHP